jgi:hypothetical protein
VELLNQAQKFQTQLASDTFALVENRIKKGLVEAPEMTDIGFLLRELERAFDEMRKEAKMRKEFISRILAAKCVASLNEEQTVGKFVGDLATATPDAKVYPKVPKPGSVEYAELLRYFGVPDPVIKAGVLKPSFTQTQEWLQARAAEGLNPPDCLGTYSDAICVFRRRGGRRSTT